MQVVVVEELQSWLMELSSFLLFLSTDGCFLHKRTTNNAQAVKRTPCRGSIHVIVKIPWTIAFDFGHAVDLGGDWRAIQVIFLEQGHGICYFRGEYRVSALVSNSWM